MEMEQTVSDEVIEVPDLSATDLVLLASQTVPFSYPTGDRLAGWNFYQDRKGNVDRGGKRYRVSILASERKIPTDAVRTYFRERGFTGNTAAFIALVMKRKPIGWWASIPEDDGVLCSVSFPFKEPILQVPCLNDGHHYPGLGLQRIVDSVCPSGYIWPAGWIFAAFREVK